MTDLILCMAAMFFLAWVVYLKIQVAGLQQENTKLKGVVKDRVKDLKDVEVSGHAAVYGQKPQWMK